MLLLSLLQTSAEEGAAQAPAAGTIRVWGSPQMGELLSLYERGFQQSHPSVRFDVSLKSTVTAVAGLYTRRAEIGLLGRQLWPIEAEAFASVTGHPPLSVEVATGSYDVPKAAFALMVVVHGSNPIASLTMGELARIFGATAEGSVHTWGELRLKGVWAKRPIHLYGFPLENDKAQVFSKLVFGDSRRWSCSLVELGNGADHRDAGERIAEAVAADPDGIGISNVHYATARVRVIPLAQAEGKQPVMPTRETVASRRYPLSRAVFMVIDPADQSDSGRLAREFVRFVLSEKGIAAAGLQNDYLPLTPEIARKQRQIVDALNR